MCNFIHLEYNNYIGINIYMSVVKTSVTNHLKTTNNTEEVYDAIKRIIQKIVDELSMSGIESNPLNIICQTTEEYEMLSGFRANNRLSIDEKRKKHLEKVNRFSTIFKKKFTF